MDETKIIYYVDDEETPYLIRFQSPPEQLTLADFKNALNRPNYKFFFKSLDDDFGIVKEEIADEDARLPYVNGRVVSWLVTADGSTQSDNQSSSGKEAISGVDVEAKERGDSNESKLSNYKPHSQVTRHVAKSEESKISHKIEKSHTRHKFFGPEKINMDETDDTFDEIDSIYNGDKVPPLRKFSDYKHGAKIKKGRPMTTHSNSASTGNNNSVSSNGTSTTAGSKPQQPIYESSSSMMSSDLDTTSFFDSEDESSRFSSCTETTMSSKYGRQKRQMRRRRKMPHLSRASSFSSMTDSTVSLNIITVTLNMDTVPFLGISIVGQTNGNGENGDGGIYVGSIMKGGAVALDGRIEPGDMILEVNGISFENVSNEEAVRTLREEVQRPGAVTLVVAKSWDTNPTGYMLSQQQPQDNGVRPIDPRSWVMHTQAMGSVPVPGSGGGGGSGPADHQFTGVAGPTGHNYLPYMGTIQSSVASTVTTNSSSLKSSSVVTETNNNNQNKAFAGQQQPLEDGGVPGTLSIKYSPSTIVRAMAQPDSGLLVRDRLWLKITIYSAFIGSDLVDWLHDHVQGLCDRKEARKYAAGLLKTGHIRHTVNKSTFSEQCYYVFNELHNAVSCLNLESDIDSVSVVAGQQPMQQAKCRLMPQMDQQQLQQASKESPVLSSGFQSACSNSHKWSSYSNQGDMGPVPGYVPGPLVPVTTMYPASANFKAQPFYPDNVQSQNLLKQHLNINLKTSRPPGSVHSGSGSSASGSSSNVTRNMGIYHLQNQQQISGPGILMTDGNLHCPYNSPPPSYQQSIAQMLPVMNCKGQPMMVNDVTSNQMSLLMQNENSSSGFFSDGLDKCD